MGRFEGIRAVAFDLDGTLVDSAPDLAAAANAMLDLLGHRELPEARIAATIGDGIDALVARALRESLGAEPDPSELATAKALMRDLYAQRTFVATTIYPGVREGLAALAARGLPLACITNKHSRFTNALLAQSGLAKSLALVLCADAPETRKPAPFLLEQAARRFGIASNALLYVGDSALDVAAARAAGCPVALVRYGYNKGRPPEEAGADALIDSLEAVPAMLGP